VSATIAAGATLELAGTASALAAGPNRVNVTDHGLTANSVLLVTGANQQVGNVDGTGSVNVQAGADLTANHFNQSALIIGGAVGNPATVAIAASDANGNPLTEASPSLGLAVPGAVSPSEPFGASAASTADELFSPLPFVGEGPGVRGGDTMGATSIDSSTSISAVPEPQSAFLAVLAVAIVAAASSRRRKTSGDLKWRK
jgi:hypothetical protein